MYFQPLVNSKDGVDFCHVVYPSGKPENSDFCNDRVNVASPVSAHPEMVDFGSGQGLRVFETAGIVGYAEDCKNAHHAAQG